MKRFFIIAFLLIILLTACSNKATKETSTDNLEVTDMIQIIMEDGGVIKIELYGNLAPITVENFKKLVSEGFYDGLIFHRVIKNFMIQCGDPTGTGYGGASEKIYGEFSKNGFDNPLKHERGIISMGRGGNDYNSASSHFFICQVNYPSLNGLYASFGRVVEGMDVVDQIANTATGANDKPLVDQVIKTMTIIEE